MYTDAKNICAASHIQRNINDTAEFRVQLKRIQSLIDRLDGSTAQSAMCSLRNDRHLGTPSTVRTLSSSFGHTPSPSNTADNSNHPGGQRKTFSHSHSFTSSEVDTQLSGTSPNTSVLIPAEKATEAPGFDLRSQDICQALSQLTISHVVKLTDEEKCGPRAAIEGNSSAWEAEVMEAAKAACSNMPQRFMYSSDDNPMFSKNPGPSIRRSSDPSLEFYGEYPDSPSSHNLDHVQPEASPSTLIGFDVHTRRMTIEDVLKFMPDKKLGNSAVEYYLRYVDWFLHPVGC
jgi:hypothetical protein